MTERNETAQPATLGQVERGVGRLEPEREDLAAECCYCHEPTPGWLIAEGAVGKRWRNGALEYHCYTAKCWD